VEGDLLSSPGRAGIAASIAPVVFIPGAWLDSTGTGAAPAAGWICRYYYKLPKGLSPKQLTDPVEKRLEKANVDFDTVESRKRGIGNAFGNFGTFLNLVGFIALLLGCIGVAGAVHIYIKANCLLLLSCAVWEPAEKSILRLSGSGGRYRADRCTRRRQLPVRSYKNASVAASRHAAARDISTDISLLAVGQGVALGVAVAILSPCYRWQASSKHRPSVPFAPLLSLNNRTACSGGLFTHSSCLLFMRLPGN
jgi:putative ABC transport system permease protein